MEQKYKENTSTFLSIFLNFIINCFINLIIEKLMLLIFFIFPKVNTQKHKMRLEIFDENRLVRKYNLARDIFN